MSILQGKDDIFLDLRQKFWNTYKSGLMYWPFVQLTNFSLVPVPWRTAYTGLCGFLWATFLCFSQQGGDGTLKSAFASLRTKGTNEVESPPEKWQVKNSLKGTNFFPLNAVDLLAEEILSLPVMCSLLKNYYSVDPPGLSSPPSLRPSCF